MSPYKNDPPLPDPIVETYQELHAARADIDHVEHASVITNISADCAVATLLNKPCASSTHEAAIAIEQPDVNVTVDMEPVGIGLSIFGFCIAAAAVVIARRM